MPDQQQYQIGDIVAVLDRIGMDEYTYGTIQKIEPAEEQYGETPFYWIYIRANNDLLNIQTDPNIGLYWTIIESESKYLSLVSRGTTS